MVQTATLPLMLKQLRLSSIAQHWQPVLEQAQRHGWNHAQYLSALCEQELADRERRRIARYSKDAHLLVGKTLASFDFTQVPEARERIEALSASADWTHQARNLLLFGPSGVGNTHLAAAIGHELTVRGVRVRYFSTTALVQSLQQARTQLHLEDALHKLDRYTALILDDFGYVKKSETETQVLFELIAHRYETGSLIITSNQPFAEWDRIFPDQMMTVAAVDRLVHHATIIELNSDSYRRKQALGQMGTEAGSLTSASATITPPAPATTTPPAMATTTPPATENARDDNEP
jgi:DNA replication protein DnaC